MKTLEERVEFLEREYERIYHDYELLSIYIPKHCALFEKFMTAFYKWKDAMMGDSKFSRELAFKAWEKELGKGNRYNEYEDSVKSVNP